MAEKICLIDHQIAWLLCTTVNVFTPPLPFHTTQIIDPITIKGLDFSQSGNLYTR